ncbi:MAG TPA: branched-chain amino acid ABC transporter substrate-binding protein [Burkholderiales bacterium]|jgi:branched-chain amino acid transport system substrate-binding protein|nr:branched-chain amino acid ABC transporter substrate-binding protein [Burkholderiales bacterium]
MKRSCSRMLALAGAAIGLILGSAVAIADTIRIGYIDPLSGTFGNVGENGMRTLQMLIEEVNAGGGVLGRRLELVALDSKANPQDALIQLQQLIDRDVRFFFQGNSSAVAGALSDAVAKHNTRNPDRPILYLNYGAVDPALTNDRCNFWHFRFDADADMKMAALTSYMATQKKIRKVYLINQDYAFGHAVARAAKEMLKAKRPDVQIVGDDLHPLGKVKDFSPYVAKIRASGADTVVTGNWGADLALLVRAGKEAGLNVEYYTYYAGVAGGPAAIGEAGDGHVRQVSHWFSNVGDAKSDAIVQRYRKRFPDSKDDFYWLNLKNAMDMLVRAMNETKSTDPLKVARALEGMKLQAFTGEIVMRADNHQILQPMFISTLTKAGKPGAKFDVERTGMGFRTEGRIEAKDTLLPTTCKMQRP